MSPMPLASPILSPILKFPSFVILFPHHYASLPLVLFSINPFTSFFELGRLIITLSLRPPHLPRTCVGLSLLSLFSRSCVSPPPLLRALPPPRLSYLLPPSLSSSTSPISSFFSSFLFSFFSTTRLTPCCAASIQCLIQYGLLWFNLVYTN